MCQQCKDNKHPRRRPICKDQLALLERLEFLGDHRSLSDTNESILVCHVRKRHKGPGKAGKPLNRPVTDTVLGRCDAGRMELHEAA